MTQWYYRDTFSRKIGPLSTDEFEQHVEEGDIQPETRVWRSGLVDWTTYEALLAHAASHVPSATGPAACAAPESSSYTTLIALGASATNRRASACGLATPVATPHPTPAPAFEKCPDCGECLPANLFVEDGRRVCGTCVQRLAAKANRDRLRDARGVDAHWLGKYLVRLALVAAAFVAVRVVMMEMGSPTKSAEVLPTPENLLPPPPR
jgi:hypothetical protein